MAVRNDFSAGEVLAAADLNDTFSAKLNLAGGKILQIVRATDTTDRTTTSGTFVDVTGMSVTITPQKSDSAVIVLAAGFLRNTRVASGDARARLAITDSSNNVLNGAAAAVIGADAVTSNDNYFTLIAYVTPATTSAVTYKLRFRMESPSGVTVQILNSINTGQIYAIEVSA
jgi:hypothetical protein